MQAVIFIAWVYTYTSLLLKPLNRRGVWRAAVSELVWALESGVQQTRRFSLNGSAFSFWRNLYTFSSIAGSEHFYVTQICMSHPCHVLRFRKFARHTGYSRGFKLCVKLSSLSNFFFFIKKYTTHQGSRIINDSC